MHVIIRLRPVPLALMTWVKSDGFIYEQFDRKSLDSDMLNMLPEVDVLAKEGIENEFMDSEGFYYQSKEPTEIWETFLPASFQLKLALTSQHSRS